MLNTPANFHTGRTLRTATITVGAVAGVALVASYLYSASYGEGSFQPTAQFLYNGILFGGAFAWFITNALRWLQERLFRTWNHIIFGAAAIAAIVVGGRIALDIAIDAPNDSHETIYQAVLASSLLAAGAIAAISALQRPHAPDDSADQKPQWRNAPHHGRPSSQALRPPSRITMDRDPRRCHLRSGTLRISNCHTRCRRSHMLSAIRKHGARK